MRLSRIARFTGAIITIGAPVTAVWAQATFTDLGSLPGPFPLAEVAGVSADGTTVVGASWGRAFRWRATTGMVGLEFVNSPWLNYGQACSADGSVVVGYAVNSSQLPPPPQQAWVWDSAGHATRLLDDPINPDSAAHGVSADGSVVVGEWHYQPVIWRSAGERESLASGGLAFAVSSDGTTVVGTYGTLGAFRWTAANGLTVLATMAAGHATSGDGRIIAGFSYYTQPPTGTQASVWTAQVGVHLLGDLPGVGPYGSAATGMSADGWRVVGYGRNNIGLAAFAYEEPHGIRDLRTLLLKQHGLGGTLNGWQLFLANGISADGLVIAGTGTGPGSPNNYNRAWLARLPRCPGDYNRDGVVSPADVTAFVSAWFQSLMDGNDWGDFDLDGVVTPADVAGFVKAWYAAVTGACS